MLKEEKKPIADDYKKDLAGFLRNKLDELGWSQQALAKSLEVSPATVSHMLSGKVTIDDKMLNKLFMYLNIIEEQHQALQLLCALARTPEPVLHVFESLAQAYLTQAQDRHE